jgi:VanZ family protein
MKFFHNLFLYFSSRKKLSTFLAIAWTVLIIVGCSLPGKEIPKLGLFENIDKVVHFVFFGVFVWIWLAATNKKYKIQIVSIAIVFGIAIEFYQKHFIKGRSFDAWDAVADSIGAIVLAALV